MENQQCVLSYNSSKYTEDEVKNLASTLTETELKEKGIYIIMPCEVLDNSDTYIEPQKHTFKIEFTPKSLMEKSLDKIKRSL